MTAQNGTHKQAHFLTQLLNNCKLIIATRNTKYSTCKYKKSKTISSIKNAKRYEYIYIYKSIATILTKNNCNKNNNIQY